MYDIIGDVHGYAAHLERLLHVLGYRKERGAYRYPRRERLAVFVGDLIDRGPAIPEAVAIARAMVDAGSAVVICGNHEYNALAYHTEDDNGNALRSHSERHTAQHRETLRQYSAMAERWKSDLAWFAQLPLWFETPQVRVVHAAWDAVLIEQLRATGDSRPPLRDLGFLRQSAQRETFEYELIETLLKGVEIQLPDGLHFEDKDGAVRHHTRVKWWLPPPANPVPLREIAMPPAGETMDTDVVIHHSSLAHLRGYNDDVAVFFGHYWLRGNPEPWTPSVACVDYSVAAGGVLAAYRFDGTLPLRAEHYHTV